MPTKPIKAKNGWAIRACWYDANGSQKQKYRSGFMRSKDARDWAIEYENQNQSAPVDSHKITTQDFLEKWLKIREESGKPAKNTIRNNRNDINKLIPYIGQVPLQNLRLDQIQEAINAAKGKKEKPLSARSKEMIKLTIQQALRYAVTAKILKDNPSESLTSPSKEESGIYILSPSEAIQQMKLLHDMGHEAYIPFALGLFSGLRRGEALGIEWASVDFEKREMNICNQYTVENGKFVHKSQLKTDGSKNMIPMTDTLYDILVDHKADQEESGRIEKYVCAINGELPNLNQFNRRLKQFQIANDFTTCRFHDLRHTYATLQLEAGVDIRTISEMLRHKTKTLAMKTYLHPNGEMKHKAAQKLNNVFIMENQKKSQTM